MLHLHYQGKFVNISFDSDRPSRTEPEQASEPKWPFNIIALKKLVLLIILQVLSFIALPLALFIAFQIGLFILLQLSLFVYVVRKWGAPIDINLPL